MSVDVTAIRARLEAASPGALIEIVLALRLRAEVVKAERDAALARLARVEALGEDFESEIDWSDGRSNYGDNEAWQQAADRLRAALEADRG